MVDVLVHLKQGLALLAQELVKGQTGLLLLAKDCSGSPVSGLLERLAEQEAVRQGLLKTRPFLLDKLKQSRREFVRPTSNVVHWRHRDRVWLRWRQLNLPVATLQLINHCRGRVLH